MNNLCSSHTHELVNALHRKGMRPYISTSGQEAKLKATRWLHGSASRSDFDPYVVSVMEIFNKTRMLADDFNLQSCPLCLVEHRLGPGAAREWIDNISDLMVLVCKANELPLNR